MKNIFVLYGGPSVEHEVSITSAAKVIGALDRNKYRVFPFYIDKEGCFHQQEDGRTEEELTRTRDRDRWLSIADFLSTAELKNGIIFPVMHGTYGEDGSFQGFLEVLDRPYTGDNVLSSALCMDKGMCSDIFKAHGIPQANYVIFQKENPPSTDDVLRQIPLPLYVKPCNGGSSVGVHFVTKIEDLKNALTDAFSYDRRIIVEEAIEGEELQIGVLGNDQPLASRPGVYGVPEEYDFFDYDAKYNDDNTKLLLPFPMEKEKEQEARALAERAYEVTGCCGYARIDIFLRKDDQKLIVNEINTSPGMTSHSMFPKLWTVTEENKNLTYPQVLDRIIELAEENYERKKERIVSKEDL
ncbi:MAG: D-alanine--D-alanine ligase family protein [Tissierellia bacterium]|nr:D-alanine--D-alanine ligase family protein [Tissierellia bacterium]